MMCSLKLVQGFLCSYLLRNYHKCIERLLCPTEALELKGNAVCIIALNEGNQIKYRLKLLPRTIWALIMNRDGKKKIQFENKLYLLYTLDCLKF